MNCLSRGIGIERAEIDEPRIQVVAGINFDRFLRGTAITDKYYVVLKCSDLDRSPGDTLNHSSMFLQSHGDHVADLERAIGVQ